MTRKEDLITLTYNGETKPLVEWCRELGLNRKVVNERRKRGLSIDNILFNGSLLPKKKERMSTGKSEGKYIPFISSVHPKSWLTLTELRQLKEMYNADCSIHTICLYLGISKEYAMECIEAAKYFNKGHAEHIRQLSIQRKLCDIEHQRKEMQAYIESIGKRRIREPKKQPLIRPKAEYTNPQWNQF